MLSRRSFLGLYFLTLALGLRINLPAHGTQATCEQERKGHIFTLAAPEVYQVQRHRKGGTRQDGTLIGVRFNYDHIRRYKFYWGLQGFYGSGELRGHNAIKDKVHSRLSEEQVEGALGYTLAYKHYPHYSLTPYVGGGYFRERNRFHWPSPLRVKFTTDFWYGAFGFLSRMQVWRAWTLGLNARFKLLWDTKCIISGDPENKHIKQQVGDRMHYRLELPLVYRQPLFCRLLQVGIMPFYEYRCYGGRKNFPFDFFETRYHLYGVDLQFIYEF